MAITPLHLPLHPTDGHQPPCWDGHQPACGAITALEAAAGGAIEQNSPPIYARRRENRTIFHERPSGG